MRERTVWVPLACYLGVTVAVPLLNGHVGGAGTHLLTVALTAALLTLLRIAFERARQRWRGSMGAHIACRLPLVKGSANRLPRYHR